MTDDIGRVAARHDFLPFGEEIAGGTGGRSNDWGITDYVYQQFTSQVRDSETGLDYFNARYYGSALGRFLSADPANAGARMGDPQSWNGYGYVRNSPLDLVDPSGMCTSSDGSVCFEGSSKPACRWWQVWCWAGSNEGGGTPEDVDEWVERFISGSETILTGGGLGGGGQPGGGQQQQQQTQTPPPRRETCPSVPAAPPAESVDGNIASTTTSNIKVPMGMAMDPSPSLYSSLVQRWFDNVCCWTSPWNYNAVSSAYDDAGNFNFGATGKALGLPRTLLMWGGGLKKNLDYWSKNLPNPYRNLPYMNDQHKMAMISQGIQYVENGCNH